MNELRVSLENIIPLTFARDHFSQIVSEVQSDKLFVLTKGGKPAVAIIDVKYLEQITGGQIQPKDIKEEIKKAPEKVGLPPMVTHPAPEPTKPTPPPPAGYAAPQVPKAPEPPKPVVPTPPQSKPLKTPPVPPAPGVDKSKEPTTLTFPANATKTAETAETDPNAPGDKIDVQFNADVPEREKNPGLRGVPSDDGIPPAQYAGEQPDNSNEEPDEMEIG